MLLVVLGHPPGGRQHTAYPQYFPWESLTLPVCSYAVPSHPGLCLRPLCQVHGHLRLSCTTTSDQESLLHLPEQVPHSRVFARHACRGYGDHYGRRGYYQSASRNT